MILDGLLTFTGTSNGASGGITSGPQTDSPTTGTQVASNIIDLGLAGLPTSANGGGARDMGNGDDPSLKLNAIITTTFAGGTSLQIEIDGAPDNGSGGIGSYTTYATSGAITLANLGLGARLFDIDWPRPPAGLAPGRFYRLSYVIATATTTAGAVIASVVLDRYDQYQTATVGTVGGYPAGIYIAN